MANTNKNDLEIAKIYSSTQKFHSVCNVVKHFFTLVALILSIYFMFLGLKPFLSTSPEIIVAMSKVIDKLNFSNITSYLLTGATGTAWYVERKAKIRAITEKGRYQRIVEGNDAYRSTSGLTGAGQTPKGRI